MTIEEKPTRQEIETLIARIQKTRDTWLGNAPYRRCLDIELHALRLLLVLTRIADEEESLAATLVSATLSDSAGGTTDE
jgi:hypothetical protein